MDIDRILDNFNDEKTACMFDYNEVQKYVVPSVLPYLFPVLFFIPMIVNGNSAFCKFHANQQLTWFLVMLVIEAVKKIIGGFPVIGWIVNLAVTIALIAISVCLMYGASKGKALRLPFIGELINIF